MEKDFDSKLRIESNSSNEGKIPRSKSFELGSIYGVGSYSKEKQQQQQMPSSSASSPISSSSGFKVLIIDLFLSDAALQFSSPRFLHLELCSQGNLHHLLNFLGLSLRLLPSSVCQAVLGDDEQKLVQ
ncbi:3-phosphoinositide-dependent protein kinase 1 [Camellia lanceoleosa]|uniref:3-phosphoinositide-dependent protein kinase 1 n=1 Tax=Camellia lanceoleosa TaxID=1840588 RepID=A0ACC0GQW6_9ERIC|nr:3-phosphoinositide-dependent protein kinase 1 [Camellia lanceoleosa]